MKPVFYATIKHGCLVAEDSNKFRCYLFGMVCLFFMNLKEGQRVYVTVQKPRHNRSTQQNRYYFGVVVRLLSDHTGYSDDEMHDALRLLFLKEEGSLTTIRSTASLSTVEFENYMTKIRQWAAQELSLSIPEPNEVEV